MTLDELKRWRKRLDFIATDPDMEWTNESRCELAYLRRDLRDAIVTLEQRQAARTRIVPVSVDAVGAAVGS